MRNTTSQGRKIPAKLKLKLFYSIPFNQAASLLFIVTLGLFVAFYPLLGIHLPILKKKQTYALIKKIESTNLNRGKAGHMYAYSYIFYTESSQEIQGVSYSKRGITHLNDSILVNYDASFPERSNLNGMKKSLFPTWTKWLFFLMFFISFKLFREGIKKSQLKIHLIKVGKCIKGKIISLEKQNVAIMGKEQYKLHYSYTTANGSEYTEVQEIYHPDLYSDKEDVVILYSDLKPEQSILMDSLPHSFYRFFQQKDNF